MRTAAEADAQIHPLVDTLHYNVLHLFNRSTKGRHHDATRLLTNNDVLEVTKNSSTNASILIVPVNTIH